MKIECTLEQLKQKSNSSFGDKTRMPPINKISELLTYFGISHSISERTNIVEYRSKGKRYVNSRHRGKTGKVLRIEKLSIELDTSSSYYSFNTWRHARDIVELIDKTKLSLPVNP